MPLEVDYLPVATGAGANVDSQADFAGGGYQVVGFVAGLAKSAQLNKVMRQSSMIGNAVATFISNVLGINVLDDGNSAALIANLTAAISASASGIVNAIVPVAFSATPVFNAALGSAFEITLTGNVTSATLENVISGQRLKFIIKQDSVGGHSFNPPGTLPLSPIGTAGNSTSMQNFFVDLSGNVYQDGPISVQ
jgi:hypothetical protein